MQTTLKKTVIKSTASTHFKNEVDLGLSATVKYLPSKYFYDKKGDAIFVEIMNMPEYYLTNAEYDIFKNKTQDLISVLKINHKTDFDLIELGAGDGTKTKELLKVLDNQGFKFTFLPVDISKNALSQLESTIHVELPNIKINTKQGDYFNVLEDIKTYEKPKVLLFLGSNIGNLSDAKAAEFLKKLSTALHENDKVVLGVDLIKPKHIVLPAYHDAQGITSRFNLNLLERINRELDADFNLDMFVHDPEYDEKEGIAQSFLKSLTTQQVKIGALNKTFILKKGERIHTETSRKYNETVLNALLKDSNLKIIDKLMDSNNYFADFILEKIKK
ncbi:L-histidine N(alpha)-methyltransferase [Mariniflexile ostreae]|uniref:L-histidine N(Alpha)-methyltransferase n=1 Tax=Mariniflexile ostreae TaxID=1520892 RepID=A0ABV5FEP2_9FLAO